MGAPIVLPVSIRTNDSSDSPFLPVYAITTLFPSGEKFASSGSMPVTGIVLDEPGPVGNRTSPEGDPAIASAHFPSGERSRGVPAPSWTAGESPQRRR